MRRLDTIQVAGRDAEIASLRQQLSDAQENIDNMQVEVNELRQQLAGKETEVLHLAGKVLLVEQQLADRDEQISDLTISSDTYFAERNSARDVWRRASKDRDELRQQLAEREAQIESLKASMYGLYELENQLDTAWAQAHRLALELECLIMDTKDNAIVSKWWDSAFEAMEEYHKLKPGAAEDAEAWAKMRKAESLLCDNSDCHGPDWTGRDGEYLK